jgi:hypothetical protein
MVRRHIDRQGPGFRLNFFVDEVGQFIAGNIKLMLNLQTIAESLATRCEGRSWIVVTAQEDMDSVIGGMSRTEGDDFTKIQARFANRLKLTSTNVAEVIQRRLLQKTEDSKPALKSLYEAESGNFKTMLGFTDGSTSYKNYRDVDHFIDATPSCPTSSTSSSRSSRACRCTTSSRASTARSASAPCWRCSRRWPSRSRASRWASWRPST